MGRVLTNNISLNVTKESSLNVAGADWSLLEPNALNTFGATTTKVARSPISKNRQRRKGTITDLDSSVEFDADLTRAALRPFLDGFCFAKGVNANVTDLPSTEAADGGAGTDSFVVAALDADQADKFEVGTLIWVGGFSNSQNNGLHALVTDALTSATALEVATGSLVAEVASAEVSFAGYRIDSASTVTWTWDAGSKRATLNSTGVGTLLTQLGLTPGQTAHIGSIASEGATTVVNGFENATPNDMVGYARVVSLSTDDVVFDKVDPALQFTDAIDPITDVDIVFGEFYRNVTTDSAEYLEQSYQFEVEYPGLDAGGPEYEYALGNFCNQLSFDLPLTDKATASFAFVGTDTEPPVTAGSRKAGASASAVDSGLTAFNTSSDIARLRITEVDETGLTTDFKSLTLTLNNNVSPEKVLGNLGAKFLNTGNFEVDIETQLLFTDGRVVDSIRNNDTLTMDFKLRNEDGVISVDLPSLTLDGGGKDFPVNETVTINVTAQAFGDEELGTSVGISLIPIPLP